MTRPVAIDLFCGLGGWTEGLLAEGYDVVGFDIERHQYGDMKYPARLIIQDVLTLHGSQFCDAALIVASPPCQAYSYRAMPWKRAKALPPPDNTLFEACFRIQREACEAADRHIPLIVENVRGAQKWVGRARWNFGSFYLWGDVPALMPPRFKGRKVPGFRFDGSGKGFQTASVEGIKNDGGAWFGVDPRGNKIAPNNARDDTGIKGIPHRTKGHWTNPAEHEGVKFSQSGAAWFDGMPARQDAGRQRARRVRQQIEQPQSRFGHDRQNTASAQSAYRSDVLSPRETGCGMSSITARQRIDYRRPRQGGGMNSLATVDSGAELKQRDRAADDWYVEPHWAVAALLKAERFIGPIWDGACGRGTIPEVCRAHGYQVEGSDLVNRGYGAGGVDFLTAGPSFAGPFNVLFNPPFALAEEFIAHALSFKNVLKVGALLRWSFAEGGTGKTAKQKLRAWCLDEAPLARVYCFANRVSMPPGSSQVEAVGGAVAFGWFVWDRTLKGPATFHRLRRA